MEPFAPERWKPALHAKYWYLEFWGAICTGTWMGEDLDMQRWEVGNCFASCAQAEQARDKIKEILLNFHKGHGH